MVSVENHETATGRIRVGPFLAGDQPVLVESNVSAFAELVDDRLRDLRGDGAVDNPAVISAERAPQSWMTSPWVLRRDGRPVTVPVPDESVLIELVAEIDSTLLAEGRGRYIPVRAAALTHDGRGVLLAGGHRTGKSTLAAALVRRGWGYISDAVSLLDAAARPELQPYWRPFTSVGSPPTPASELGALAGPTPLAAIVIPREFDDRGPPARVPPAAAVGPLTAHLPLLDDARSSFHRLVTVASTVPAWEISYVDVTAVDAVAEIVDGAI